VILNRCEKCNGKLYIEAPPFNLMTDEDIVQWKKNKGRIMIICEDCGCESTAE